VQFLTYEFVFVLNAVRLLLLSDKKLDLTAIADAEDTVVNRGILDRKEVFQLGSGVNETDFKLVPRSISSCRSRGDGWFFVQDVGVVLCGLGVEKVGCITIGLGTGSGPYRRLGHRCLDQVQWGLGTSCEERVEVS